MKHTTSDSTLTDTDLDNHIDDLQSQLRQIQISLQLAKEERDRRTQNNFIAKDLQKATALPKLKPSDTSTPTFQIGSKVRIRNKYRGNKGKVGKIVQLSTKTATVFIPNEGNYIKFLHNLELLST